MEELIRQLAELYRQELAKHKASGNAYNSFNYSFEFSGTQFNITYNLVDYWKFIELGRKPGKMPPVSDIEKWIQVKHIVPNASKGKVPTTRQLAYVISKSIGKNGTKGTNALMNSLHSEEAQIIIKNIEEELYKELTKEIDNEIS